MRLGTYFRTLSRLKIVGAKTYLAYFPCWNSLAVMCLIKYSFTSEASNGRFGNPWNLIIYCPSISLELLRRVMTTGYRTACLRHYTATLGCWRLFWHDGAAIVFTLVTDIPFVQYCIIARRAFSAVTESCL